MTDRDGPAIHVHLRGVPAQVLVDGACLRREGFVGFDQVEVVNGPAVNKKKRSLELGPAALLFCSIIELVCIFRVDHGTGLKLQLLK